MVEADATAAGTGAAPAAFVPFYRKPGWWKSRNALISQGVIAALGIALLFILLFPVVKAIAQHVVNVSVLNIDTAQIVNPTNTSFNLSMQGVVSAHLILSGHKIHRALVQVTHTGIFNAKITFTEPVNVRTSFSLSQ